MPTAAQVESFRDVLEALTGQTVADLEAVWVDWPWDDPAALAAVAAGFIPDLTIAYAEIAAALAADQYDDWRDEAAVAGRFVAAPADVAEAERVAAGVRYSVGSLWGAQPDQAAARSLLSGSVHRYVMGGATDTITANSIADPAASGWERHVRPGACGFCRMLAGRGGVYRTDTVRFKAHNSCSCVCAPSWDPDAEEPLAVAFVASKRVTTAADRQRVYKWLRDNDLA